MMNERAATTPHPRVRQPAGHRTAAVCCHTLTLRPVPGPAAAAPRRFAAAALGLGTRNRRGRLCT